MNPERDREFEQNVSQLIHLLRKIMKNLPAQGGFLNPKMPATDAGVQFNINFFSFFPMTTEDWEAIDEMYDAHSFHHPDDKRGDFTSELNSEDIDFLRNNGISF